METKLYPYKAGDVPSGNWQWAVGADSRYGNSRPYCVATINFHGAIASGLDPEKLAPLFAAAPELLAAAMALEPWARGAGLNTDELRAAIAKAKGAGQ